MKGKNLYLKPEECTFLSIAIVSLLDQVNQNSKNQTINWAPEVRKSLKEMLAAGTSLKIKLIQMGIEMKDLPKFDDEDFNTFFTKES